MKRLIGAAFAAALASTALFALATPASAAGVCVGTGTAQVNAGLSYPTGPSQTTGYSLDLGTGGSGGCFTTLGNGSLSASGTLTGHCGRSFSNDGNLTTPQGSVAMSFTTAGSMIVVSLGGATVADGVRVPSGGLGLANAVPLPTTDGTATLGNSCSAGTAAQFQVTGLVEVN